MIIRKTFLCHPLRFFHWLKNILAHNEKIVKGDTLKKEIVLGNTSRQASSLTVYLSKCFKIKNWFKDKEICEPKANESLSHYFGFTPKIK